MKTALIQDDNDQWWKFDIPESFDYQMTFYPAGFRGPYFAIQRYMEGEGWEHVDGCWMGPPFERCVNGVLKTPVLLFGLAGDGGGVRGKPIKFKEY